MALGTFNVNAQGDIASDSGLASYRKRVFRRLTTQKDQFAHLKGYGVSIPSSIKQLARAGVREMMAIDAEEQIRQEPETTSVRVTIETDPSLPSLVWFRVTAKAGPLQLNDRVAVKIR